VQDEFVLVLFLGSAAFAAGSAAIVTQASGLIAMLAGALAGGSVVGLVTGIAAAVVATVSGCAGVG
jgi:hypothetical protein